MGFDWEKLEDIYEKMAEEIRGAESGGELSAVREEIEEEIGDLLFTVVNISRRHAIDPENALRLDYRQVHPEVRPHREEP